MANQNPYDATNAVLGTSTILMETTTLSQKDEAKAKVLIRAAQLFWIAAIIGIVCPPAAISLIGPWYALKVFQWNSLAAKHPSLLTPDPTAGSLADRFQRSKLKLLACVLVGLGYCMLFIFLIVVFALIAAP